MKKNINKIIYINILLFISVLAFSQSGNLVPFKQRASIYSPNKLIYSIRGDFNMIGNTNITLKNYFDDGYNGFTQMAFVDIDDDETTFNSSSATLTIPSENGSSPECDSIIFAGLYWTGRAHSLTSPMIFDVTKNGITKTFDKRKIKILGPLSSTYTELTAKDTEIFYPDGEYGNMYSAYTEITDYVRANGVGEYFVADMALNEALDGQVTDATGFYGGWSIIIIYSNSKMNKRDVTLFDGHSYVIYIPSQSNEFILPISGFRTIATGQVTMKLGIMAGEGDSNIGGDSFSIENLAGNYQYLSHSLSNPSNFFNSSINTGGNIRNPNLLNNTGIDISMFEIPNPNNSIISNNQTSINFKYSTSRDTYIIPTIAMSVNTYKPEPEAIISVKTIDGVPPVGLPPYTVKPGQIMEYSVKFINPSSENILNTKIDIPIPYASEYVLNSANGNFLQAGVGTIFIPPTFNSTEGINGTLHWDIGTLPISYISTYLAEFTYKIKVVDDCRILKSPECNFFVESFGTIFGVGEISQLPVEFLGGPKKTVIGLDQNSSCDVSYIRGTLFNNIDSEQYVLDNCQNSPDFIYESCQNDEITYTQVLNDIPPNSKIYNEYPLTNSAIEYNATNPFPKTTGTTKYYIIPEGYEFCYIPMTITYNPIPTASISGSATSCISNNIPVITFTGANGTAPYTFTYTLNGVIQTVSTSSSTNTVTVSPPNTPDTYIYVLQNVKDNKGCEQTQTGTKTIILHPIPTASISGSATSCISNNIPVITFTGANGTAPYTFTYTLNGVAQTVSTSSSTNTVTVSPPNTPDTYIYVLQNVKDNKGCEQTQTGTKTIILHPIPTATITADKDAICFGDMTPKITFTGANGTAPYTFTYTLNGVAQTVSTSSSTNTVTVSPPNTPDTYIYVLQNVKDNKGCEQTQTGTKTIILHPIPTATITADKDAICFGDMTPKITFTGANGTAPYTFTYTLNGVIQTVSTSSSTNTVTVSPPNTPDTYIYVLQNVKDNKGCEQTQTGTKTIILHPIPTATITADKDAICFGDMTPKITFTGANGTAPYTFTYTLNGVAQTVSTSSSTNTVTVSPPNTPDTYIYVLQNVKDNKGCEQTQTGTKTIILHPIPTATITADKDAICFGDMTPKITFTGANGTAPYTFTYTLNGVAQTPIITSNNSITIDSETVVGNYTYNLVSVQDKYCSSIIPNQSVKISVNAIPVLNTFSYEICDDDFDGNFTFNLTDIDADIITSTKDFTFTYFESESNAIAGAPSITNPTNYTFTNNLTQPFPIWVVVTNDTAECESIISVIFSTKGKQTIQEATLEKECATGVLVDDGFAIFDLTSQNSIINSNGSLFTYYLTEDEAKSGGNSGLINNPTQFQNTIKSNQRIWIRISENSKCDVVTFLDLKVYEFPHNEFLYNKFICIDESITLESLPGQLSYQWYFNNVAIDGATSYQLTNVTIPGEYAVEVVYVNSCPPYKQIVQVKQSSLAYIIDIKYGNSTIELIGAGGTPPYFYSINGGPYTTQSLYTLEPGLYTVQISSNSCPSLKIPVPVVGWSTIFTPNNDGKNDTWQVKGMEYITDGSVITYDRYGKEIKLLSDKNNFIWDGKYLGRVLPSTSYWFTIYFTNSYINKSYLFNGYVVIKDRNDGDNRQYNPVK